MFERHWSGRAVREKSRGLQLGFLVLNFVPRMADVFRLSRTPRLFSSSPLLLIYHSASSLNVGASQLPILSKQQHLSDRIGISLPAEDSPAAAPAAATQRKRLSSFKAHAVVAEKDDEPKWWEKNAGPNMIDIHSTEQFLSSLSEAGDRLVIVEFYGTWCGSCRALFPKLCRTAVEYPDILFLKVNFDENKPMCKSLNVRVLPYFHFYRGADGQLESFSCSLAKFQKIKDAIEKHNTSRCSLGPPLGVGDANVLGAPISADKPAETSSR